jgi:hypothetical protein
MLTSIKNNYVNILLIGLILIYIVTFIYKNNRSRAELRKVIKSPMISCLFIFVICFVALYDISISLILGLALIITLFYQDNINKSKDGKEDDDDDDDKIHETFINSKKEKKKNGYIMDKYITQNKNLAGIKNILIDGINENKYLKKIKKAKYLKESNKNPNNLLNIVSSFGINKGSLTKSNSKEGKIKSKNNNLKINVRKLDSEDIEDNKLLETSEILKDMLNRIYYEYEDVDYLKKYISNRLQEIVDVLDLIDDDN